MRIPRIRTSRITTDWRFVLADDLTKKTATQLAALIRAREVSPVEVVDAYLRRIEAVNPSLNAIVTIANDAIDRAREAEAELLKADSVGPLKGLPLTVKDTIDTQGLRTTSGSRLRAKRIPDRDASVVARLKSAGAIILGKTNTPEMAIPYETDNPVFGRTNNPRDLKCTPGGSSGGEAAAIAAGLSPAGVGSDLSGSIRVPAHFCGIAGLKPTTGRIPMDGHLPEATGVLELGACIGPMARTVKDLRLLFEVMADLSERLATIVQSVRRLRVAYYTADGVAPVTNETRQAVEAAAKVLSEAGFEVVEERPPSVTEGARLWIELFSSAASEQLRGLYQGREDEAGPLVAKLLRELEAAPSEMGDKIDRAERRARAVMDRARLREELLHWMKTTPLILCPVGSGPAFEHGARRLEIGKESIAIFRAFSYSQTFNVFGLPSVSVPAGRSVEGLPIGIQIAGQPFAEGTVLRAAELIEESLAP